jgi:hypothetical protein
MHAVDQLCVVPPLYQHACAVREELHSFVDAIPHTGQPQNLSQKYVNLHSYLSESRTLMAGLRHLAGFPKLRE